MDETKENMIIPQFHSCHWCQQLLFDFTGNTVPMQTLEPTGMGPISFPMAFAGVTHEQGSPLVKRINDLLSASAAQSCLFVQEVIKGLKKSQEELKLSSIFSWVGGIELTTSQSSFGFSTYYFSGTETIFIDLRRYTRVLILTQAWLELTNCFETLFSIGSLLTLYATLPNGFQIAKSRMQSVTKDTKDNISRNDCFKYSMSTAIAGSS